MSPRSIELATLTLRDALDLAVLIEEEARDRYEELVSQMALHHNEESAQFFRFMLEVESMHEQRLLERRRKLFKTEPSSVTREMLFDVEAPDYDEVRATMTERQALEVSLHAEEKAQAFFDAALRAVTDPQVRALFAELRAEEVDHQARVKGRLAQLPPDPHIRADDVGDEPVGL